MFIGCTQYTRLHVAYELQELKQNYSNQSTVTVVVNAANIKIFNHVV